MQLLTTSQYNVKFLFLLINNDYLLYKNMMYKYELYSKLEIIHVIHVINFKETFSDLFQIKSIL
jgi:hypothetical protein